MAKKAAQNTKRKQLDKAQATMLAIVIGASAVTVFALFASKAYYSQANYLNKVATEKEKAVNQLKSNKEAVSTLVESYKSFSGQNPNLLGGTPTGKGEKDGDNGRLILDALPSKYDFPALATSIEKLLTGYTINNISGSDDTISQDQVASASIVDIPFKLDIQADYKGVQNLVTTFEKSIRPFQFDQIELSGTNNILQASFTMKSFYQPEKNLKIDTEVVK